MPGMHYVLFIFGGATLCQITALLFLNLPLSPANCKFLLFLSGLSPTLIFAAILIKTRKIYKIFMKTFETDRLNHIQLLHPLSEDFFYKIINCVIVTRIGVQFSLTRKLWKICPTKQNRSFTSSSWSSYSSSSSVSPSMSGWWACFALVVFYLQ